MTVQVENLIVGSGLAAFAVAGALARRSLPFVIVSGESDAEANGRNMGPFLQDYSKRTPDQARLFHFAREIVPLNGEFGFEFYFNPASGGLAAHWSATVPPNLVPFGHRTGLNNTTFDELDQI